MQTHRDDDFQDRPLSEFQKKFLDHLGARADELKAKGVSQIASGAPGEQILDEFDAGGVHFRVMPNDEQGILRISIGGGEDLPVTLNYCTYRGNRFKCIELLEKVIAALKSW